jgi:AbrB family looped-hinge helix DNA binding protein
VWRVRLSSKGQVVIPSEVREALGLRKGSELIVRLEGGRIILEPVVAEPPPELFVSLGGGELEKILRGWPRGALKRLLS